MPVYLLYYRGRNQGSRGRMDHHIRNHASYCSAIPWPSAEALDLDHSDELVMQRARYEYLRADFIRLGHRDHLQKERSMVCQG